MRILENLAHNVFPLIAVSGLLLAGWALISTPDNLRSGAAVAASAPAALSAAQIDSSTAPATAATATGAAEAN